MGVLGGAWSGLLWVSAGGTTCDVDVAGVPSVATIGKTFVSGVTNVNERLKEPLHWTKRFLSFSSSRLRAHCGTVCSRPAVPAPDGADPQADLRPNVLGLLGNVIERWEEVFGMPPKSVGEESFLGGRPLACGIDVEGDVGRRKRWGNLGGVDSRRWRETRSECGLGVVERNCWWR